MLALIIIGITLAYILIGVAAGAYWSKILCDKTCISRCENLCLIPGIPLGVVWPLSWLIVLVVKFGTFATATSIRSGHKLASIGSKR